VACALPPRTERILLRSQSIGILARTLRRAAGGTVAISWTIWRENPTHDDAWEKVMADPRVKNLELPFDGRRLIFGTFGSIAES